MWALIETRYEWDDPESSSSLHQAESVHSKIMYNNGEITIQFVYCDYDWFKFTKFLLKYDSHQMVSKSFMVFWKTKLVLGASSSDWEPEICEDSERFGVAILDKILQSTWIGTNSLLNELFVVLWLWSIISFVVFFINWYPWSR